MALFRGFKRKPVANPNAQKMRMTSFAAPVRGWVLNENLAAPNPQLAPGALVLDNWFPTSTGIRVRGGSKQYARVANNAPCLSLMTYQSGNIQKFFASSASAIYDITAPANSNTIPATAVSGRTSGNYSFTQFSTVAGQYLIAVNGTDQHLLFDGTVWTVNTPAITGSVGFPGSGKFSHVWSYKNRLFFVEKDTNNAWYLPVDSIGGVAQVVSMNGIFKRGGSLLFGATWSLDAGDGLDDKCLFVSTSGEVAVYEGNNPASATTWSIIGRYDITSPMGMSAIMNAGGDLLVATEDGVVPISAAVNKDSAALSLSAISAVIEPYWRQQVSTRSIIPWQILKWPSNNMMVVSQPVCFPNQTPECLVANLETGAWARFTGWDTRCLGLYQNFGYFGTNTGEIYQMEVGGQDGVMPYTAAYSALFNDTGPRGATKTVKQARASFVAASPFKPKVSVSTNYSTKFPTPPNSVSNYAVAEWDAGLWDVSYWDSSVKGAFTSKWISIGRTGYSFSPQIQITCGVTPLPRIEMVSIDLTYESGGIVV